MDWTLIFFIVLGAIGLVVFIVSIYCAGWADGDGEGYERGVNRGHELAIEMLDALEDAGVLNVRSE